MLSQREIIRYLEEKKLKVTPLRKDCVQCNGIDLRLGKEIARIRKCDMALDVHGRNDLEVYYRRESGSSFLISPSEKMLVSSLERIELPHNIMGLVGLRSTYARLGLSLSSGFIESGFKGQLTLELEGGSFPIRVYPEDRVFHVVFAEVSPNEMIKYDGRYQDQVGVVLPIFKNGSID